MKNSLNEDDSQYEKDLIFLLNCYKSREEKTYLIRNFYGNIKENISKFPDYYALDNKIDYFYNEFLFHNKFMSITEDEIINKYFSCRISSIIKQQICTRFANNLFKINTSLQNKLTQNAFDNNLLNIKEIYSENSLFRDNTLTILKDNFFTTYEFLSYIFRLTRAKFLDESKKMKSFFCCFQTKNQFESIKEKFHRSKEKQSPFIKLSKSCSKKKSKQNEKIKSLTFDLNFKTDAFQFLAAVRKETPLLKIPINKKKATKMLEAPQKEGFYDILQISEYEPRLFPTEKSSNELINERFERIFNGLMKANTRISQTINKYHKLFMAHVERKKVYEKKDADAEKTKSKTSNELFLKDFQKNEN